MNLKKIIQIFGAATAIFLLAIITWKYSNVGNRPSLAQDTQLINKITNEDAKLDKDYQYAAPWDKNLYDGFYAKKEKIPENLGSVKGGIVPHHLLAGAVDATFFETIGKQKPSVVVLIGPNHFGRGQGQMIVTEKDWQTPYGVVKTEKTLLKKVVDAGLVNVDEEAMKEEHSIYSLIPFVAKSVPGAKIVSFILRNGVPTSTLDKLVEEMKNNLPNDAVIVASIDFSHYQILSAANFHDELSKNVIRTFDYDRLSKLEIDSTPSLYAVMKLMQVYGTQKVGFEMHTNSATITGQLDAQNTTSHYSPYFVAGSPEQDRAVSILSFGDIMLDRNVKKRIDENGQDYLFGRLAGEENRFFTGMDIVAANLEGPFADYRRQTSKEIAFRFDPVLLPMLKKYNFSLFTLANNHTLDMSAAGFNESKKNLQSAGFEFYGSEYNVSEKDSYLLKDVAGRKVAFIGLNNTHTPLSYEVVNSLIKKGRSESDFVIVNVHWGEEYKLTSNKYQRDFAHDMIDAGADAIIGHHPHVTEEMEVYKDKPIFYSLGNFIFDQYFSADTQRGLGVGLVFYRGKISVYIFPLQGQQSRVSLINNENLQDFMAGFIAKSRLGTYGFNNFNLSLNQSYENR